MAVVSPKSRFFPEQPLLEMTTAAIATATLAHARSGSQLTLCNAASRRFKRCMQVIPLFLCMPSPATLDVSPQGRPSQQ
jgi:hypothetical protein